MIHTGVGIGIGGTADFEVDLKLEFIIAKGLSSRIEVVLDIIGDWTANVIDRGLITVDAFDDDGVVVGVIAIRDDLPDGVLEAGLGISIGMTPVGLAASSLMVTGQDALAIFGGTVGNLASWI